MVIDFTKRDIHFESAKRGDRTLMGRFRPNFSPKLEPIHSYRYSRITSSLIGSPHPKQTSSVNWVVL